MMLATVTPEEGAKRLTHLPGAVNSVEELSDLVRAEVHARKHAPRAATISRIARLLVPAENLEEAVLDEVCDALEREGDVMLAPGGALYGTPTRVVSLKNSARIFSSVPTRALAAALGREVAAKGTARTVVSLDGVADAVMVLCGAIVTPEAWAGFERTQPADAKFLAYLEVRLAW